MEHLNEFSLDPKRGTGCEKFVGAALRGPQGRKYTQSNGLPQSPTPRMLTLQLMFFICLFQLLVKNRPVGRSLVGWKEFWLDAFRVSSVSFCTSEWPGWQVRLEL